MIERGIMILPYQTPSQNPSFSPLAYLHHDLTASITAGFVRR